MRMALGARAGDITRDVLVRGERFALGGIAVGTVSRRAWRNSSSGLLLGVSPFDPTIHASVAGLLVVICLVASFVPARRATRSIL